MIHVAVMMLALRSHVVARVLTPVSIRCASTLSVPEMQRMITENDAVIFTKSYCPVCKDTVERLDDAEVSVKEVQLDAWDNGNDIRDQLKQQTGEKSVPFFFLKGTHMPSDRLISGLKGQGKSAPIRAQLEAAGLGVKGYFRL